MKSIDINVLGRKLLVVREDYLNRIFIKQFLFAVLSLMSLIFFPKLFAKIVRFAEPQEESMPISNERITESPNVFDDFLVKISGIKKIDEINIVMKGKSLDKYKGAIDYSLPTFFVNGLLDFTSSPLRENTTIFYGNKESERKQNSCNIINITGDSRVYSTIKNETNGPIIFISSNKSLSRTQPYKGSSNIYCDDSLMVFASPNAGLNNMQFGSGLMAIVALNNIANKINIYGWDNYLERDIRDISIIQYISYLISIPKGPNYRRLELMSQKVINLVYAYRIANYNNINIYSYLSGINDRKELYLKYKSFIYK